MNTLELIGKFAVNNYKIPENEVKKLNQEERKYLDMALRHLAGEEVGEVDDQEAIRIWATINAKLKEKERKPAGTFEKMTKKVIGAFKKRIGADDLVLKIAHLQVDKDYKKKRVSTEDTDTRGTDESSSEEEYFKPRKPPKGKEEEI